MQTTGLIWPQWTRVDPALYLNLLKKLLLWPWARQNNSTLPLSEYYRGFGTPEQQNEVWEQAGRPFYENALKYHLLVAESTSVELTQPASDSSPEEAEILRFRLIAGPKVTKTQSHRLIGANPNDYYWSYVVRKIDGNPVIDDTPLSGGKDMSWGELAILDGQLTIFQTIPYPGLNQIYILPEDRNVNEYNVFDVLSVCQSPFDQLR